MTIRQPDEIVKLLDRKEAVKIIYPHSGYYDNTYTGVTVNSREIVYFDDADIDEGWDG